MANTEREEEILVRFPRKHRTTGALEEIRITSGDYQGRQTTQLRLWFHVKPDGPDDDGWRPTKQGISLREFELDDAIDALAAARQLVHQAGRETKPASRSNAGPGSRQESPGGRDGVPDRGYGRLHQEGARRVSLPSRAARTAPTATLPGVEGEPFDDLAEYRERRPGAKHKAAR